MSVALQLVVQLPLMVVDPDPAMTSTQESDGLYVGATVGVFVCVDVGVAVESAAGVGVAVGVGTSAAGRYAKPCPQSLSGPAGPRSSALSLMYWATCAGSLSGKRCRTRAVMPATKGAAKLVPFHLPYTVEYTPAPPVTSGSTLPSGAGPRLL